MTPISDRLFFQQLLTCGVMFFVLKSFCWMSVFVRKRLNGIFDDVRIWRHLHV